MKGAGGKGRGSRSRMFSNVEDKRGRDSCHRKLRDHRSTTGGTVMLFIGQSGEERHVCGREDDDSYFEPASDAQEMLEKWVWMDTRWWS